MLDPRTSGPLRLSPEGITVSVGGFDLEIELTVDELRSMSIALAVAADRREGIEPSAAALAILQRVEGRA